MQSIFKQEYDSIRRWILDSRIYYRETAEINSRENWKTIVPMLLLYLLFQCVYLAFICPEVCSPFQTAVALTFTGIHLAFTVLVILYRKKSPGPRTVSLAITLFAAQILGMTAFAELFVFPKEVSFLFPLCLVLMTQIYIRRPLYRFLETYIPAALYLVCCRILETHSHFLMDTASVLTALCISTIAVITITQSKLRDYRTQQALEKMCALDPMTGVNNKPTFEFRVEQYLRSRPKHGYALAICDLDHFKRVNDRYGHRAGDEAIRQFTAKFRALSDSEPDAILGRFGEDEFVAFFPQYSGCQELLEEMKGLCAVENLTFPLTCSVGIAFSSAADADFKALFDHADRSLYRAKKKCCGSIVSDEVDETAYRSSSTSDLASKKSVK